MSKEESSGEVGPQDGPASDAPTKDPNADIYENRGSKKIIRVVTVMAYLFSVSFVGILLSAYYIFLWEPPNPELIDRGRLRANPHVEFLIGAEPYLEEEPDHLKKRENLLIKNVPVTRVYKSGLLFSRIANDESDEVPDVVGPHEASRGLAPSQQSMVNAMLLKLKYSLMDKLRESRSNRTSRLSHGATSSSSSDDHSSRGAKEAEKAPLNSTGNSSYGETPHGNLPVEENRVGPHRKFTTASDVKLEQTEPFSGATIEHDVTPIARDEARHSGEETRVDGSYTLAVNESSDSRSNHDVTTRRNGDSYGKSEAMKRERSFTDRRAIDYERRDSDPPEVTTVEDQPSVDNGVNCSGRNCLDDYCTSCQSERIARDRVSIDSSGGSRFNDLKVHQSPDDRPAVKPTYAAKLPRNSEETQIEKMTARSTTIDNKQLEELDLSTTQQQRGLWEILTESTDAEETFAETFTSMSTVQDYHNNFTSTMNDDDENVT